jgi:hypothetical protein
MCSYRICRSPFAIEGFVNELASGRFPRLRPFRKRDESKPFYECLCKMADLLKERKQVELGCSTK